MKVYVVWSIPDYIGIDIEGVFLDEIKANEFCENLMKKHFDEFGYKGDFGVDEYEVRH